MVKVWHEIWAQSCNLVFFFANFSELFYSLFAFPIIIKVRFLVGLTVNDWSIFKSWQELASSSIFYCIDGIMLTIDDWIVINCIKYIPNSAEKRSSSENCFSEIHFLALKRRNRILSWKYQMLWNTWMPRVQIKRYKSYMT